MQLYFGTDGIRADGAALVLARAGYALACAVGAENPSRVIIAGDTRACTQELMEQLLEGFVRFDTEIYVAGIIPTPVLSFLVKEYKADFGVMVTASHNKPSDNGLKLFVRGGGKPSAQLENRLNARLNAPIVGKHNGKIYPLDFAAELYTEKLCARIPPLWGVSVRLDCCYGATARFADSVFRELGATVATEANLRSARLVNVGCGSTNPSFLQRKMKNEDFGFAFDGDGDRVVCIKDGEILDGDAFLYYISEYLDERGVLQNRAVVGTLLSNSALCTALSARNVRLLRADVGDKYVLETMRNSGAVLGGERSGHIVASQYSPSGDGILSAALMAKAYTESKLPPYRPLPACELDLEVDNPSELLRLPETTALIEKLRGELKPNTRLIVRASGTEPKLRITAEGEEADLSEKLTFLANEIFKKRQ